MKMRLALITCIILFGALFLRAQYNFQMSYSASGDDVIEWLIPANDGNLVLAGNTNSYDPAGDGLIMKTDQDGNIIWSKKLGGPGMDVIVKIVPCSDSGYVAIGYTNSYGQGDRDAWITRISEEGDVVWSYSFGTYSYDAARGIIATNEGGFIVVGQEETFDVAFILALNSHGELQWKKEYYQDIVIWFNDVYETDEGELYFTGAINHDGFGIHDTFTMETDPTGNIVRCKYYGDYENDSFRSIMPYLDGFLVVGDTWSWQGHQLGWMAKINKDLDIEKSVVLGENDANQFLESACFISNSIYADIKFTSGNSYIIKLDSMLNLIQSWQFNPGYTSYSSHLISLENNLLVFSGSVTDNQTLTKDIYLTKFHPGEMTTECNDVAHETFLMDVEVQSAYLETHEITNNAVYERITLESTDITLESRNLCLVNAVDNPSIKENDLYGILLYPNPATGSVQISIKSDEIPVSVVFYNQVGMKVMSLHPDNNIIDIRALKPGVYIMELVFREYTLKRRLLVIQ
jgi:hypothetical protein